MNAPSPTVAAQIAARLRDEIEIFSDMLEQGVSPAEREDVLRTLAQLRADLAIAEKRGAP